MDITTQDRKLLTLSLLLRTLSKNEQLLLIAHFSPEVVNSLNQIEQETGGDLEKLDWTPFYQSCPELQKILLACREEIKSQKVFKIIEEQRTKIKDYMLTRSGKQKKGPPTFLSKEVMKVIDHYLQTLGKAE